MKKGIPSSDRHLKKSNILKVAIALDSFPEAGGGHQYTLLILEALMQAENIEIICLCNTLYWRVWCHKNGLAYRVINWPSSVDNTWSTKHKYISKEYNKYFTQLGAVLSENKIDILFITMQILFIPPLKVKVITPVHDLMHKYEQRFPEVGEVYHYREKIFKLQAKFADVILTDSELGKKQYIDSYGNIMKKKQKVYSLPFIPPDYIRRTNAEFIETPDKYIFYPAQFWQHKNHLNLIKAVELVKNDIPDIRLVLCGSKKNYYYEVEKYITKHHMEKYVQICGYVSNEQMTYLYLHATAMFMPSFFGPTNLPPLEALKLGCPVAVSNNYGMPEQVGAAGLLFNPESPEEIAQCINTVWNNDELRREMVVNGYRQVNKWTENDFKNKVLDIVGNLK